MKAVATPSGLRHRKLSAAERRAAIRKGWEDFQFHGWAKDPPYPDDDPRRWSWMNGAEMADALHRGNVAARIEDCEGWRDAA